MKKKINFLNQRLAYRRHFSAQDVLGKTKSRSKYAYNSSCGGECCSCASCGSGACADGQCD